MFVCVCVCVCGLIFDIRRPFALFLSSFTNRWKQMVSFLNDRAATISGHTTMIAKLLEYNADPNVQRTVDNATALMGTAISGDLPSCTLLLAAKADPNL